jgi:hypothetical protein
MSHGDPGVTRLLRFLDRPGMYIIGSDDLYAVIAFAIGMDHESGGRILFGFDEFMRKRVKREGTSLRWDGQFIQLATIEGVPQNRQVPLLCELLREFLGRSSDDVPC